MLTKPILIKNFTLITIFILTTAATTVFAKTKLPSELSVVTKKYSTSKTMTARFEQKIHNASLNTEEVSEGRIFIMRPNLFRWETHTPDPSILTSNGKKAWYYIPPFRAGEAGQVTVKKASEIPSKLAINLMAGRVEEAGEFAIETKGPNEFKLVPLALGGDLAHIELVLESQTKLVYKVHLITRSGNRTEITLKDIQLSPKLSASMFTLQIPKGTEVIR